MKPFDLTKALAGDPVVTRDGRPVTEIHLFKTAARANVIGAVVNGAICTFRECGRYYSDSESCFDLFMAPKKRTVWVNLYPCARSATELIAAAWITEELANAAATGDRIGGKAYPVQIDE